jgi:Ca-activated chloride channel family protein
MKTIIILIFGLSVAMSFGVGETEIKGFVMDNTNSPLIGASVLVKGTTNGTITDIDGSFSIKATIGQILYISYTGYESKEIEITKEKLNITLDETGNLIDEVVVGASQNKSIFKKMTSMFKPKAESEASDHYNNITYHESETIYFYEEGENYSKPKENGFSNPKQTPYSTFSLDVDKASYSNVRRFLNEGQKPPADAVRIEEMINYFEYDYKEPTDNHPIAMHTAFTDCPWNPNHKLLHVAMKAKEIEYDNLPASNLVFLIDVSGSMSAQNKLPMVVSSLKMLVKNLRPQDKIAIVTYSGYASIALESTSATETQKIIRSLESLTAEGGTAGADGIHTAYKIAEQEFIMEGNNRIILATDGDFNVGVNSADDLEKLIEKKRNSGIYLSVLGYGMGNYQDHKMQTLAYKGNGNHAYIDNLQEAKKVLINEFGGTLFTIAKDVKIQVEFNPAYVQSYRLIGYENRMLNKEDFNDDKKDAGEVGAGHCVTAIYEVIPQGVKSEFSQSVDDLKYQKNDNVAGEKNGEIAEIKCRYKHPDQDRSIKFNKVVSSESVSLRLLSNDVNFSISVAEFAMILSESQYLSSKDLTTCIKRAKESKASDKNGYRSEFVRLAETFDLMD